MLEKLKSILKNKCPRCHQGSFFIEDNPYNLKKFDKMNKSCSVCHENFEREPGFFYGSMYINYGLTVILGLKLLVLQYFIIGFKPLVFLVSFTILLLLLIPVLFRTSRLIWINIFVSKKKPQDKI
jgi:uncharacterized protein (DUF983 family)